MNVQTIRLDISKTPAVAQVVRIGQCDSSGTTIRAEVYDNGAAANLSGMSAMFEMRLPDGQHYVRDAGCTVSGNVIEYVVDEEHCAVVPGITDEAYFDVMDGASVVYSTNRFRIQVLPSAHADGEVQEGWDNAIDSLIQRGEDFMDDVEQHGIPLMSASVRGGAKLGSGLAVVDGTLGVDLSNVNTGVLPIEHGGTGSTSAAAALAALGAAAQSDLDEAEQAIADNATAIAGLRESISQRVTAGSGTNAAIIQMSSSTQLFGLQVTAANGHRYAFIIYSDTKVTLYDYTAQAAVWTIHG